MAEKQAQRTVIPLILSIVFTALIAAVAYWLWQDTRVILRPLRGPFWASVKDLSWVINLICLIGLLTMFSILLDKNGASRTRSRVFAGAGVLLILGVLIFNGDFLTKLIN